MKQATILFALALTFVVGGEATAQQYPYPSMFEPNDAWRGVIKYHRGLFGRERYVRRWGNGITDNGLLLGTNLINGITTVLTSENIRELLKLLSPEATEPAFDVIKDSRELDAAIRSTIDAINKQNDDLLKEINEMRSNVLAKKDGEKVEPLVFPHSTEAEPAKPTGTSDPNVIDPSGLVPAAAALAASNSAQVDVETQRDRLANALDWLSRFPSNQVPAAQREQYMLFSTLRSAAVVNGQGTTYNYGAALKLNVRLDWVKSEAATLRAALERELASDNDWLSKHPSGDLRSTFTTHRSKIIGYLADLAKAGL